MPKTEIDVDPCDHITSDAIGQPGQRVFYIQALQADKTYTVIIEKTQLQSLAWASSTLAEVARIRKLAKPAPITSKNTCASILR
jgi:hypothetical protein